MQRIVYDARPMTLPPDIHCITSKKNQRIALVFIVLSLLKVFRLRFSNLYYRLTNAPKQQTMLQKAP